MTRQAERLGQQKQDGYRAGDAAAAPHGPAVEAKPRDIPEWTGWWRPSLMPSSWAGTCRV